MSGDRTTPKPGPPAGERELTHDPHPFHIVGECEDCCTESEALRLGFPDPSPLLLGCETPGCANNWPDD